jgi:hypothetical protein
MSAHVLLSDTFDQWRMKNNEWLSMNDPSGSLCFIKTNETTNSTSNTTGGITTAGGLGTGSSATIAGELTLHTNSDLRSTTNLKDIIHTLSEDADDFDHLLLEDGSTVDPNASTEGYALIELNNYVDIDGAVQIDAAVTVGVDGTGQDVKFFGDTSAQYMLWDESADELVLAGDTKLSFHDGAGGENIIASADGHLEVNVGTTLDITAPTVDINVATLLNIDGDSQFQRSGDNAAFLVGWDDTGHDVYFYGDTSGKYLLWDQSEDELALLGATKLSFHDAAGGENIVATSDGHLEINAGTTLDITAPTVDVNVATKLNVDGPTQLTGTVTVGVDDTGHDVKFFGASAGAKFLYDQSADTLEVRGPSADASTSTGKLLLSTALTDINDGDVLGRIDFKAPLEAGGTDAITAGASIWAEADATFSSSVNSTDLVFATGDSGAATEKMRIDSTGQVTFADGAIDVNIASHDKSNGLKLGGTLVTATAADFNGLIPLGKCGALAIVFATS